MPNPRSQTKLPVAKSKAPKTKGTALDIRQRELLEQQSLLEEEIAALQRTIKESPHRAHEERRQRRESALAAGQGQYRHYTVVDASYEQSPRPRGRRTQPMLRAERRAARRQTLALLVAVIVVAAWAASWLLH